MRMKPILFNTDMVRAILDGRKTVTRRLVKPQPGFFYDAGGVVRDPDNPEHIAFLAMQPDDHEEIYIPPYQPGDILYIRETWGYNRDMWLFKANYQEDEWPLFRWHPSIHMPKKAARIFLRVKDVRVARLQDMEEEDAKAEGIWKVEEWPDTGRFTYTAKHLFGKVWSTAIECFRWLWTSTIKPADVRKYGWDANPWVWVIEFEKISKEEAMKC